MRPPWPRLAHRSLVRGGPAGPGCGLGWPRQEWPGVTELLIQLHSVAFRSIPYPEPSSSPSPIGRRDSILRGNDGWGYPYCESLPVRFRSEGGQPLTHFDSFLVVVAGDGGQGVNPGPIWPCLALFTPSGEAENEATAALVGTPLTPTQCASMRPRWPCQEWPEAGKLLFLFRFVPFRSISYRPNPHPRLLPGGEGTGAFAGTTEAFRVDDVCEQCSNRRGYGAMGCCRWFGGSPPEGEPHPLIVRTIASSLPCALLRTWMPAFAGMTETGDRDAEPVSEVAPKALTSFVQDDIGCQERL